MEMARKRPADEAGRQSKTENRPSLAAVKSPDKPGRRYGGVLELMAPYWSEMEPNPRQLNTEEAARHAKHLRVPLPEHAHVEFAELPDGRRIKLNGHTRGLLWQTGEVEAPPVVYATRWYCDTMQDVVDAFMTYDNPAAVDNVTDLLYGVCREYGLRFQSDLLGTFKFASGLGMAQQTYYGQLAYNRSLLPVVVKDWMPELQLLDDCAPTRKKFVTPVAAGALLLLRAYPAKAPKFLASFQQGSYWSNDGQMDAVLALKLYVDKHGGTGFAARRWEVLRVIVATYLAYAKDRTYGTGQGGGARALKAHNFQQWLDRVKAHRNQDF